MHFKVSPVRTTLAIDDDVLMAARGLAERQRKTVGEIISSLARQALRRDLAGTATRNGVLMLPVGPDAKIATLEHVNQLRDELS